MTDYEQNDSMTATQAHEAAEHPMAGVGTESWSSPQSDPATREDRFAKLVLKRSGAETDIEFPVNPPCVIGRFDPMVGPIDIDLGNLPEAMYISRKHAVITCEDDAYRIKDLGSSNGTYVLRGDFERVEEATIEDEDEIALGNARFVFRLAAKPSANAGTAPVDAFSADAES
jgi:pSer/pThr/pTyr-binding forkhead associated (FHA) protein